jgi:hypothetical protein
MRSTVRHSIATTQEARIGLPDRPGIREEIVHAIRRVFEGRVIWGEDLMQIVVGGGDVEMTSI